MEKAANSSFSEGCELLSVQLVANLIAGIQLWSLPTGIDSVAGMCCHAPASPSCPVEAWFPSSPHTPRSLQQDAARIFVYIGPETCSPVLA